MNKVKDHEGGYDIIAVNNQREYTYSSPPSQYTLQKVIQLAS
jgi:hypothetical protein